MHIKILGSGCANCHTLQARTQEALAGLGITAEVTAVTDYPTIAGYGVMSTPALVIDEQVVMSGRVPAASEVAELINATRLGAAG
jgi:small redox-active disulfide protein 2